MNADETVLDNVAERIIEFRQPEPGDQTHGPGPVKA
jgi:hypothetical protein